MTSSGRFWVALSLWLLASVAAIHAIGDRDGSLALESRSILETDSRDRGTPTFPRTVTDARGNVVTIPFPPQRIVSNEMAVDELLFNLIEPGRIVAVSPFTFNSSYSFVAEDVERLGLRSSESPEVALSLRPDLVITGTHVRAEWIELMQHSDAPIYHLNHNVVSVSQLGELIRRLGYLTGSDQRARKLVTSFKERLERVRSNRFRQASAQPRILGYDRSLSSSYGVATLFHDVVTLLNGINVGAEQGLRAYDGISSEQIAIWNPDWIVTGAEPGGIDDLRVELLADPGVAITTAARSGQILVLPRRVFLSTSHNVIELIESLAKALYPEEA